VVVHWPCAACVLYSLEYAAWAGCVSYTMHICLGWWYGWDNMWVVYTIWHIFTSIL